MTGPLGNSELILFPLDPQCCGSRGNKTHCFPWGQSLRAYCSLSFCNEGYVCLNVLGPPLRKDNVEKLRQLLDRVKLFKASLRFLYTAVFVSFPEAMP